MPDSANRDTTRAWNYHDATKHSEWSIQNSPHYLDWANQPLPLKIYTTLEAIPLPREADQTGVSALSAIGAVDVPGKGTKIPDIRDLGRILYFSAGITKKKAYPGGEIYFRAAACTGALYQFELYLVCGDLPDLQAGVYHFSPGDFSLRRLRSGDHRGTLVHATAGVAHVARAPAVIVCTGTYWRNAWKYRTRTYRHFGWDNGTILANMKAMAAALQLPATIELGFVDSEVNTLLDVDTDREVAFSMVTLGHTDREAPAAPADIAKLNLPTVPISKSEVDYPELREMHAASSLATPEEVAEWQDERRRSSQILRPSPYPLPEGEGDPIEQVILRRGSSRKFERQPIALDQLMTILRTSTQTVWHDSSLLNELYLVINAVDGLEGGAYHFDANTGALELLKKGNFRNDARRLGLHQDLPGDAAAAVFFLADLHSILAKLGNRGYRTTQLEAGILGGRMYLSAYALRIGATGLTFFDDDVTAFFAPHAAGKSAIFLVALGKGQRQIS